MLAATAADYPEGSSYNDYLDKIQSHYKEQMTIRWPPASLVGFPDKGGKVFVQIFDVKEDIITETFPGSGSWSEQYFNSSGPEQKDAITQTALNTPPTKDVRTRIIWVRYLGRTPPAKWALNLSRMPCKEHQAPGFEGRPGDRAGIRHRRFANFLGERYRIDPMFFIANFRAGDASSRHCDVSWPRQPLPSVQQKMVHVQTVDHVLSAAFIPPRCTEPDAPFTGKWRPPRFSEFKHFV